MRIWAYSSPPAFFKLEELALTLPMMPIVYVGAAKTPLLFSTDAQPWLSTFWETVREISHPDGHRVLFHINIGRYISRYTNSCRALTISELHKHKLVVSTATNLGSKYPNVAKAMADNAVAVAHAGIFYFYAFTTLFPAIGGEA